MGLVHPSGSSAEAVQTFFTGMSYHLQINQSFGVDQGVWPPDTQIGVGTALVMAALRMETCLVGRVCGYFS